MKKFVSVLLAVVFVFSFAACTKSEKDSEAPPAPQETQTAELTDISLTEEASQTEVSLTQPVTTQPLTTQKANDGKTDTGKNSASAGATPVQKLVKNWATNGIEHLYDENVVNILLVGQDWENGTSRSDAMMLVSVNKNTKQIFLTSFLRDSYTYMNIGGSDRYDKTNHSYHWGGPQKLMEVLSNNYKIKIDHYISIGFSSFVKAIDVLGGVDVMVTEEEAEFMNRTTKLQGFESGSSVKLDGQHALVFVRIRKLDSEEQRTARQRRLVTACLNSLKNASADEILNVLATLYPYAKSNYSHAELIEIGTQAMADNWLDYEIVSRVAPSGSTKESFRKYKTYSGNLDVWIVDYVKAAQEVQRSIYGKTNITIDDTYVSAIALAKKNG